MMRGKWLAFCGGLLGMAMSLALASCSSDSMKVSERDWHAAAEVPAPAAHEMLPGQASEELWVIEKASAGSHASSSGSVIEPSKDGGGLPVPGEGVLVSREKSGKLVPVPLEHTDVSAQISGYIASVNVSQRFANPFSSKIEAVYVFPLPENAGINEFVMTIGDRHIRGIIRERQEAQQIYNAAKAQGYVASLMTQERPNIFVQSVANIEPKKEIDAQIRYFHTLTYNDGWYEWVFPMVVGPRYDPSGAKGGAGADVPYPRPNQRSGHDISLKVSLDAGVDIGEPVSVNHKIIVPRVKAANATTRYVELAPEDSIPNKDFVLRWKVAAAKPQTALFVQHDKDGGYFTLLILPPENLKSLPRRPVEMVFVVDTSDSMNGEPIAQAKAAVDAGLAKLQADDTFQVVQFASTAARMSEKPLPATPENIAMAHEFVQRMEGEGGTEILAGINQALSFPHDENRTRVVAFFTGGSIGNEAGTLKALHQQLETSRVFSFGVGTSPNRYLLNAMAALGHGDAAYLSTKEPAQPVIEAYFEKISHPALTNVRLDFGGMKVSDVYPRQIPELFVGRPVIITGRFAGALAGAAEIKVSAKAGREELHFAVPVQDQPAQNAGIEAVWARAKIADLEMEGFFGERDVFKEVRQVALSHGLMSAYTSFGAVDSARRTEGDHATTVATPVPVPEAVHYQTTVPEK